MHYVLHPLHAQGVAAVEKRGEIGECDAVLLAELAARQSKDGKEIDYVLADVHLFFGFGFNILGVDAKIFKYLLKFRDANVSIIAKVTFDLTVEIRVRQYCTQFIYIIVVKPYDKVVIFPTVLFYVREAVRLSFDLRPEDPAE